MLWDSCYESGEDYVGTAADIEEVIGWTGSPGALAAALVDAGSPEGQGFIEPVDEGVQPVCYRVHDLWHHAPNYVSNRRTRETERRIPKMCKRCGATYHAADPRSEYCSPACRTGGWRDRRNGNSDRRVTEASVTVTECDSPCAPALAPAPALTPTPVPKSVSSEPHAASEPERADVALWFPVVGQVNGNRWPLRKPQIAEWAQAYPGLDILGECRKALSWINANPGRRKTVRGMPKFLNGWLGRTVDRRGATGSTPATPAEKPFTDRELSQARDWWRRVGCAIGGDADEHMASYIRRRLRLEES